MLSRLINLGYPHLLPAQLLRSPSSAPRLAFSIVLAGICFLGSPHSSSSAQSFDGAGEPTCSVFSENMFNFAPAVVDSPAFRAALARVVETSRGFSGDKPTNFVPVYLPHLIQRLRQAPRPAGSFSELGVAGALLGRVSTEIPEGDYTPALRQEVSRLTDLIYGTDGERSPWTEVRRRLLSVYDLAVQNSYLRAGLSQNIFVEGTLPTTSRQLIELANHPTAPAAILARGLIALALESQARFGVPSLNSSGIVAINANRVFQDMLYLGYSCPEARELVNKLVARERGVLASYDLKGQFASVQVTYRSPGGTVVIPYPKGFSFTPKTSYPADKPLNTASLPALARVHAGDYRVSDFAIGRFDNVAMDVTDPLYSAAALNLIRSFPERTINLDFSPEVARAFGMTNFPALVRETLQRNGVSSSNVTFSTNSAPLGDISGTTYPGNYYPWTRDLWLWALRTPSGNLLRLRQGEADGGQGDYVELSTVGGAHYPIGRYIFLSKSIWSNDLPEVTSDNLRAYKEKYQKLFGREPVLVLNGTDQSAPRDHVDTFMIFLPQGDGKPVIGVADIRLGRELLDRQDKTQVLAQWFLSQQLNVRLPIMDRPRFDPQNPANTGLPLFAKYRSYGFQRRDIDSPSAGIGSERISWTLAHAPQLDATAEWLKQNGFTVFRFPVMTNFSQANGLPELSSAGAFFTAVSFPAFDATLARLLGEFGYSLRLVPTNSGIEDFSGLHCLTNEARF